MVNRRDFGSSDTDALHLHQWQGIQLIQIHLSSRSPSSVLCWHRSLYHDKASAGVVNAIKNIVPNPLELQT